MEPLSHVFMSESMQSSDYPVQVIEKLASAIVGFKSSRQVQYF